MKSVLVLTAHDDDEVLGVGGAIQFYKKNKYEIYVCQVTDGSSTQYKEQGQIIQTRQKQHQKALSFLGVKNFAKLHFPDMKLDSVPHHEINDALQKVLEDVRPEIIFVNSEHDVNKDHQEVYKSSLVITRPPNKFLKKLYSYEVLSSSEWNLEQPFKPNFFININEYLEKKQRALAFMKTELRKYPHPRSIEGVKILAQYRGLQAGCKYAEAFKLIKEYA